MTFTITSFFSLLTFKEMLSNTCTSFIELVQVVGVTSTNQVMRTGSNNISYRYCTHLLENLILKVHLVQQLTLYQYMYLSSYDVP